MTKSVLGRSLTISLVGAVVIFAAVMWQWFAVLVVMVYAVAGMVVAAAFLADWIMRAREDYDAFAYEQDVQRARIVPSTVDTSEH